MIARVALGAAATSRRTSSASSSAAANPESAKTSLNAAASRALVIVGQFLQIDAEDLAELQQQGHGHRPLVVLDEVEIARADAEPLAISCWLSLRSVRSRRIFWPSRVFFSAMRP